MTTTLYRAFDRQRRLLYVGISDGLLLRFSAHADAAAWARYAEVITLERFDNRAVAAAAELAAIRDEDPVFNKYGRPLARWRQWMAAYPNGDPDATEPEEQTGRKQVMQLATGGQCVFQTDLFIRAMAERGHRSELARSRASGIHRSTLHRWRPRPIDRTPANAHQVAAASGLTVDQLFVPAAA
jgi:hypothetical protein